MTQPTDMTPPPNPIAALSSAVDGVKQHLQSLDEREEEIRRERKAVTDAVAASGLSSMLGQKDAERAHMGLPPEIEAAHTAVARPILALGQNGLPHRIVAALRATPAIAVSAVATAVKATPKETYEALKKLTASGTVVSTGKARGTRYSLSKAGAK